MSILKTLRHHAVNALSLKFGSNKIKIIATILMIFTSLLPYSDIFLGLFVDVNSIKLNSFPNLGTAIWSFSMCLTPLILIAIIQFKPYWLSYLITIYVYLSMFFGFLFLEINFHIESDFVFRVIVLFAAILILILSKIFKDYFKILILKDEIITELKK